MTIQLLHYFNGQAPGLYLSLGAAEESRLIGLGLARDWHPAIDGRSTDVDILGTLSEKLTTATTSGNVTLRVSDGTVQRLTLDAIRQITMPSDPGAVGASVTLILNCAGFTPTWAGVTWLTVDGLAPTLNTVAGKRNLLVFVWDDNGGGTGAWLGMLSGMEV